MSITDRDIAQLEKLAQEHKCVEKILQEHKLYTEDDMVKMFKYRLARVLDVIGQDLDKVADGDLENLVLLTADDKVFDKIWKIETEIYKVEAVFEAAKNDFKPPKKKTKKEEESKEGQVAF